MLDEIHSNDTQNHVQSISKRNSAAFSRNFIEAESLFVKLAALEKMRLDVVNMKQAKISEIRAVPKPDKQYD